MRTLIITIIVSISAFLSSNVFSGTICVDAKLPLQEQFKKTDATYIINDIIDLKGEAFIVPVNSTVRFKKKGSLENGTIVGNNTLIVGSPHFQSVHLKGLFVNDFFYTSWCSPLSMSDFVEDVMNLSENSTLVVDNDITLTDSRREVTHLNLRGKGGTIINSDRFYITHGGCSISNLRFKWTKTKVKEPKDKYSAVIIYRDFLLKDTTVTTSIVNVEADGGRYCSYFMRQYKSSINPKLRTINYLKNCTFENFTRGAIWTCGGTGIVENCIFRNIGYESTSLYSVTSLRLGYSNKLGEKAKAIGYLVSNCVFNNIVAAYNSENDGRELHGLFAYGDSIRVINNQFHVLSTSFSKITDTGKDSEMLYIKGSNNTIENNSFEEGAGSSSDAVVTLKIKDSENNVVRNNRFFTTYTCSKFLYLGGRNHLVEGNEFLSKYSGATENPSYAIYLGHVDNNSIGIESVTICNNAFSFSGKSNFMVVYANHWGNITMIGNTFHNPTYLLKCNNREGSVILRNNIITLDNVQAGEKNIFISLSGRSTCPAIVKGNEIRITKSKLGILLSGDNYCFENNKVAIERSSARVILRGDGLSEMPQSNKIKIDKKSTILSINRER